MTNFRNRYASAVRSKNLRSDGGDQTSDADVIGAAGLAGRAVRTLPDGTKRKGKAQGAEVVIEWAAE
jgi:hypothetical protein